MDITEQRRNAEKYAFQMHAAHSVEQGMQHITKEHDTLNMSIVVHE